MSRPAINLLAQQDLPFKCYPRFSLEYPTNIPNEEFLNASSRSYSAIFPQHYRDSPFLYPQLCGRDPNLYIENHAFNTHDPYDLVPRSICPYVPSWNGRGYYLMAPETLFRYEPTHGVGSGFKPHPSYINLISAAILGSEGSQLVLSDIYQYILERYPYFRDKNTGWRNSIRHNLSLNECFVKCGRSANGKGHFWSIHPANIEDFRRGDFSRRKAQKRLRAHLDAQKSGERAGSLVKDENDGGEIGSENASTDRVSYHNNTLESDLNKGLGKELNEEDGINCPKLKNAKNLSSKFQDGDDGGGINKAFDFLRSLPLPWNPVTNNNNNNRFKFLNLPESIGVDKMKLSKNINKSQESGTESYEGLCLDKICQKFGVAKRAKHKVVDRRPRNHPRSDMYSDPLIKPILLPDVITGSLPNKRQFDVASILAP